MKRLALFTIIGILVSLVACNKNENFTNLASYPQVEDFDYTNPNLPNHLWSIEVDINSEAAKKEYNSKVALGKVLFYDKKLSLNNTVSCGTCHKQSMAFADGKTNSMGLLSKNGSRNAMALANIGQDGQYFWDLRANGLVNQVLMPVQNHLEMGLDDLDKLAGKLSVVDYYHPLFTKAFGEVEITKERIAEALSSFLEAMVSYQSKYDVGMESDFSNFTVIEKEGLELFNTAHCNSCHNSNTNLSGWGSANIGLDVEYKDKGLGALADANGNPDNGFIDFPPVSLSGDGHFKIPPLRNIALTGPYMHDGRYNTLEEVINHYSETIKPHPSLSSQLMDGYPNNIVFFPTGGGDFVDDGFGVTTTNGIVPRNMHFTVREKSALLAFLHTLTDTEYTRDPRFTDPFVVRN